MTEPLDDARGELLALARMLKAIHLRVEINDWRLSEGELAVLDTAYDTLLRCATIIRPAPARCDAGSARAKLAELFHEHIRQAIKQILVEMIQRYSSKLVVVDYETTIDRILALSPDPGTVLNQGTSEAPEQRSGQPSAEDDAA